MFYIMHNIEVLSSCRSSPSSPTCLETGASQGPFLIAAPASVLPNWLKEFDFWAPAIHCVAYAGSPETREEVFRSHIRVWTKGALLRGLLLVLALVCREWSLRRMRCSWAKRTRGSCRE